MRRRIHLFMYVRLAFLAEGCLSTLPRVEVAVGHALAATGSLLTAKHGFYHDYDKIHPSFHPHGV